MIDAVVSPLNGNDIDLQPDSIPPRWRKAAKKSRQCNLGGTSAAVLEPLEVNWPAASKKVIRVLRIWWVGDLDVP